MSAPPRVLWAVGHPNPKLSQVHLLDPASVLTHPRRAVTYCGLPPAGCWEPLAIGERVVCTDCRQRSGSA